MKTLSPRFPVSFRVAAFWICAIGLVLSASRVQAQWSVRAQVGDANFVKMMDEIGQPHIGYIGISGKSLLRSTDTGHTWRAVTVASPTGEVFRDIVFKPDGQTGWAVSARGIYRTLNGGLNWTQIYGGNFVAVHYMALSDRVFVSTRSTRAVMSTNDGDSWTDFAGSNLNGFTQISPLRAFCSPYSSRGIRTTDGGYTWVEINSWDETWQPLALKDSGFYFMISEKSHEVVMTTDEGESWQLRHTLPQKPTGCARGNEANIIAQTTTGMLRSTDLGSTWESLCGPDLNIDTRFWVRGTEIFALSSSGYLLYNPTSQRGGYSEVTVSPFRPVVTTDGCTEGELRIKIATSMCGGELLSARLDGDPELTLMPLNIPQTFFPWLELDIRYSPTDLDEDSARLHLIIRAEERTIDTFMMVYGKRAQTLSGRAEPDWVDLTLDEACVAKDGILKIRNPGCDPYTIDSIQLSDPDHFALSGMTFPYVVPGQSTRDLTIHTKNATALRHEAQLYIYIRNAAGSKMLTTTLELERLGELLPVAEATRDYAFMTSCQPRASKLDFRNPYCDGIIVDTVIFSNLTDFTPSAISYPYPLNAHETLSIAYTVQTPQPGPTTSKVTIKYTSVGERLEHIARLTALSRYTMELPADTVTHVVSPNCPTFDTTLDLRNTLCDDLRIISIKPAVQPAIALTLPQLPVTLRTDEAATIGVATQSFVKGNLATYLLVKYEAYGVIHDTVLHLNVRTPKAFSIDPRLGKVAFGRTSVCAPKRKTVYVTNEYCVDVSIERVQFSTASSAAFTTIYKPAVPTTLRPGERDSIVVEFAPDQIGARNAAIELRLRSAAVMLDTFFTLDGIGSGSVNAGLRDEHLAMGMALTCEKLTASTVVTNDGCVALDLTDTYPDGAFTLLSPALPYRLEPGDSVTVTFEASSTTPATVGQSVTLRLLTAQNIEQLLECKLKATFVREEPRLVATGLELGQLSDCSAFDTSLVIANPNVCEALSIEAAFLNADATVVGVSTVVLRPGESGRFDLRIRPNTGNAVMLRLRGNGIDTSVAITYNFVSAGQFTMADAGPLYQTTACDAIAKSYTIDNTTCTPVEIQDITITPVGGTASRFTLLDQVQLPLTLGAESTAAVRVQYDPRALGVDNATLSVSTTDRTFTYALNGSPAPRQAMGVTLTSSGAKEVIVGDEVSIELALSTDVQTPLSIDDMLAEFGFDTDMLTLRDVEPIGDWALTSSQPAARGATLRLQHPRSTFASNDPVARLTFRAAVAKDVSGSITLNRLEFNPSDTEFNTCVVHNIFHPASNDVNVKYFCGAETLRELMHGERPIRNIRVNPHPAHRERALTLSFDAAIAASVDVELVNVLGISMVRRSMQSAVGQNEMHIVLSGTSSGWHLLRIRTTEGSSGVPVLIAE